MLRHGFLFTLKSFFDIIHPLTQWISNMSNEQENQFKVHDIVGLSHSISLAKISSLSSDQLTKVMADFTDCDPVGWDSFNDNPLDIALAHKYKFDIDVCTADEDFVLFGFSKGEQKKSQLSVLFDLYPETAHEPFGVLTCDTYFAHIHNDKEVVESAGQIMFVVKNDAEHILYSKDSGLFCT
jgi:hypothetical protein